MRRLFTGTVESCVSEKVPVVEADGEHPAPTCVKLPGIVPLTIIGAPTAAVPENVYVHGDVLVNVNVTARPETRPEIVF